MDNLTRFLALIAWSEGTSTNPLTRHDGYDVIVSGPEGPEVFTDFKSHPFDNRAPKLVRPGLFSTAAGRYQILRRYWDLYMVSLHLPDFSPPSQDAVATQQMREVHALPLIQAGNIADAINKCSGLWASLPGNNYGQGAHTLQVLLDRWAEPDPTKMEVA